MAETKMQLADWLDDLCVRFIINLPEEELESAERICFQVEEAQWFYEDFVRPLDPMLPSLNLRQFCLLMFQRCPLLAPFPEHQHVAAFDEFLAYKVRVPVRGAIMLDQNMEEVVLVKGWKKSANWSFPRGKINKDEDDLDCAIREVYEETGFDIRAAGLVNDKHKQKHIDVTMREQHMKLFVFRGVSKNTIFIPRTRKEISKIQWYRLADLPGYHKNKPNKHGDASETVSSSKLYMVAPFMQPLKKWIALQRKAETLHLPQVIQDQSSADQHLTDQGEVVDDGDLESTNPVLFQHLLTKSQTDELVPHFLATQNQQANAENSSQLKKLLNVGTANSFPSSLPNAAASDTTANRLLAILQQGTKSPPLENLANLPGLPRTLIGQISVDSPTPSSPHHHQHHHQLPPPSSTSNMLSPPSFAIPLSHTVASHTRDTHTPLPSVINSHSYQHNHYPTMHVAQVAPDHGLTRNYTGRNLTENDHLHYSSQQFSQHPGQIPRPYQFTGNPQYDNSKQNSVSQVSNIAHFNEKPVRNLSSHAQNLLDACKAKGKPMPIGPSGEPQSNILPSSLSGLFSSSDGNKSSWPTQLATNVDTLAHSQSRSRQALANATDKPATVDMPLVSSTGPSVVSPTVVKASSQRDNLLSLFRSPIAGKTMMDTTNSTSQGLQPAAFELSAIPSPRPQDKPLPSTVNAPVSTDTSMEQRAELSAIPSPNLLPKVMKRHAAKRLEQDISVPPYALSKGMDETASKINDTPPHTSATLPGPPNVPDIGTVKRKLHAPKSPSLAVANAFSRPIQEENSALMQTPRGIKAAYGRLEKSTQQQTHRPTPIQILKRPISHAPASPSPDMAMTTTAGPSLLKKSPATPTIPISPARIKARSPKPPTPKPFQPQILRRPQPSSSVEWLADLPATIQSTRTPFSAHTTTSPDTAAEPVASIDRKQALLSLFSAPTITATPVDSRSHLEYRPSVIGNSNLPPPTDLPKIKVPTPQPPSSSSDQTKALLSLFSNNTNSFKSNNKPILPSMSSSQSETPVATAAAAAAALATMPPPPPPLASSRVVTARSSVPPELGARSRLDSMASVPGSGTQTPISPSDRGFLVSYLRGL